MLGWLPRKARAAARNGRQKFGLEIFYGDEHLKQVWYLYTLSMRRLGTLSYPYSFFRKTVDHTPNGKTLDRATVKKRRNLRWVAQSGSIDPADLAAVLDRLCRRG